MLAWLKALSIGKKIGLGFATLLVGTAIASPAPETQQQQLQTDPAAVQSAVDEQNIETKTVTEKLPIEFKTVREDDPTLDEGKTRIAVEGKNGERTITYEVTYVNGDETDKKKLSDEVTTKPVNAVVKVGTKVYSPPEPSHPPGASAKCRDGTYSYSQNRRGTCSHHGGVAEWL